MYTDLNNGHYMSERKGQQTEPELLFHMSKHLNVSKDRNSKGVALFFFLNKLQQFSCVGRL